jgi:hypothetical protein
VKDRAIGRQGGMPGHDARDRSLLVEGRKLHAPPGDGWLRICGTKKRLGTIIAVVLAPDPRDIREDMAQRCDRGTPAVRTGVRGGGLGK